jgi:hypothetical protein
MKIPNTLRELAEIPAGSCEFHGMRGVQYKCGRFVATTLTVLVVVPMEGEGLADGTIIPTQLFDVLPEDPGESELTTEEDLLKIRLPSGDVFAAYPIEGEKFPNVAPVLSEAQRAPAHEVSLDLGELLKIAKVLSRDLCVTLSIPQDPSGHILVRSCPASELYPGALGVLSPIMITKPEDDKWQRTITDLTTWASAARRT